MHFHVRGSGSASSSPPAGKGRKSAHLRADVAHSVALRVCRVHRRPALGAKPRPVPHRHRRRRRRRPAPGGPPPRPREGPCPGPGPPRRQPEQQGPEPRPRPAGDRRHRRHFPGSAPWGGGPGGGAPPPPPTPQPPAPSPGPSPAPAPLRLLAAGALRERVALRREALPSGPSTTSVSISTGTATWWGCRGTCCSFSVLQAFQPPGSFAWPRTLRLAVEGRPGASGAESRAHPAYPAGGVRSGLRRYFIGDKLISRR